MQSPRKLMVTLLACGFGLGILGGAQVSTAMKPGPEMPFRWADSTAVRAPSLQFAASVPLELDVPDDFQLATAEIDGDAASTARALGHDPHHDPRHEPRADWAALRLSAYKVEVPDRLPDNQPARQTRSDTAALPMATGNDGPAGDDPDPVEQPGNPMPDEISADPVESS